MLKKWTISFLLFFIWLTVSWAVFIPGFFRVHDFTHAARIAEMSRALNEGQFPVRWVKNLGYGYGMPLFEFYAPLPYYVGSFFYSLGLDVVLTIKLLYLICNFFTVVGGYLLGKKFFGRTGGIITSAALTLAPYRAVNLYVRGALSEAWGIMAMPWILYGIVLIINKSKRGWLILALSLTVLMLSHNLTTLMFVPISGLFSLAYWCYFYQFNFRQLIANIKSMLVILGSYLLSIGLSAFYLFPALMENKFTQINSILSGYFDYHLHFLYIRQLITPFWGYGGSGWGPEDGLSFFLGIGQLLGFIVFAGLFLGKIFTWKKSSRVTVSSFCFSILLLVLLILSLFMSLGRSQVIWEFLPFLSFIQFPWRWLSVAVMLLGLINGFAVFWLPNRLLRIAGMVIMLIVLGGNTIFFKPESFANHPEDIYYTDEQKIQDQMSSVLPDYIPVQMGSDLKPVAKVAEITAGSPASYEVLVNRGHEKLIKVEQGTNREISFAVADFPGWQAYLDEQKIDHELGKNGEIKINFSNNAHLIGIRLESTPIRHFSDWASALSLIILILLVLPTKLWDKKIAYD